MSNIKWYDSTGNTLTAYYQWDINQGIQIEGIPDTLIVESVHFGNKFLRDAIVVPHTIINNRVIADIPNTILQYPGAIHIYVYCITAGDGLRTMYSATIAVYPRQRPEDYVYE